MNPTHESLEHAEHAQHAGHSPFDRNVAMTMAIIAATLAAVTMLGHRKHNETLLYQIDSSRHKVEESNNWAWYQAKRLRQAQYEAYVQQTPLLVTAADREAPLRAVVADWQKKIAEYKTELKDIQEKAKESAKKGAEYAEKSHHAHHQADFIDMGELGVEFGLVLCSIALLTKRKGFWLSGIASALLGAIIAGWAFVPASVTHH